ncbi:helix-turn-helix domain-containing protein [Cryptosporangium aurantiacum]|uniref:Helix-turn-helix domain-containing protein n=1 Tax=Cryptosporangium aurantiacum TaxID=134849 RepID=A0A1M7QMG1_9ACTN|nr:helix-turn-helix transcriptional regulator [Cryptosporangium aurantiacum]SHN32580.1 Helix-turn-helix domain-containing protein [Cryptosporangium aurantiacum]
MPRTSPTVRRRRLGQELRALREAKGMTVEQVAKELDWSPSKVSRIETTPIKVGTVDLRALLDVYEVFEKDRRAGMLELGKESREPAWWMSVNDRTPVDSFKAFIGFEAEAHQILTYEPTIIPGLLQTEAYMRALMRALFTRDADIEEAVKLRLTRQELLTSGDDPLKYTAIIDEAALRRPAGGVRRREVMREQIEKLLTLSERSNIAIRVLPLANGLHPGMNGAFTVVELPHPDDPDIVWLEAFTVGAMLSSKEDVRYYNRVFDGVQQESLGRDASENFLQEMLATY